MEFVGVAGKNLELTEGITDFVSNNARELALSFSKVLAGKEVPTQYPDTEQKIKTSPEEKHGVKGNMETFPHSPKGDGR